MSKWGRRAHPRLERSGFEVNLKISSKVPDEGDLVTIRLIGMNEGLPYVAGGGGEDDTPGRAFATGIRIIVGSVEITVVSSAIEEGIELAKDLSEFPDCTGTALIYKRQFTGTQLIAEHIKSDRGRALHFAKNRSPRPQGARGDCNVPDYEARLDIRLKSRPEIADGSRDVRTYTGDREDFVPKFAHCAPEGAQSKARAVNRDQEVWFRQKALPDDFARLRRQAEAVEAYALAKSGRRESARQIVRRWPSEEDARQVKRYWAHHPGGADVADTRAGLLGNVN